MKKKKQLPANYEDQIKQLTAMAMSIIYDEKNRIEQRQLPDAYEQAQQNSQHPEDAVPDALANVSLWVLSEVEGAAESRKKMIQPIIVMGAIGEIVAQVAELANTAQVFEVSDEDMQVGIAAAVNKYIIQAKKEGKINDQQLQEAAQALQKNYSGEAQQFQTMISARQQRQQGV